MGMMFQNGVSPKFIENVKPRLIWHKPTESERFVRCAECGCEEIELAEIFRDGKKEFTPVCCWCRVCPVSRKIRKYAILAWNKHNQYLLDYKEIMRRKK